MRASTSTGISLIFFLSFANFIRPRIVDQKQQQYHHKASTSESKKRNVDHMEDILLRPDPLGYDDNDPTTKAVLKELERIYQNMIKPVEQQFRYADLRRHTMSEVDIYAKPLVLLVGPWSTGKSTMINYLLGIEGALESLYVGAEPTTGDFTVVSYGEEYRTVEGVVLATDPTQPFASMEKFGQIFLEHLLGVELNMPLLRNVTFIDTPGILENRRQQERGYPYNDVMRWLVHRSDLIFVVFDPTKLDVGWELESLFKQLKGKESVLRIILNKADSISEQDLIRVYGALFWSLSPLINVTEPPRVYVGSFWGEPYQQDEEMGQVLLREEKSLLHDMREVIRNRVYNKIAFLRQYAIRVRIHALLVDSYVTAYRRNKGLFGNGAELADMVVENPEDYDVFKTVLGHPNISKYDLPEPEEYQDFFRINPLTDQRRISEHCGYFSGCAIDQLNQAISTDLPILLRRFQNPLERSRLHQQHQQQQQHQKRPPPPPLPSFGGDFEDAEKSMRRLAQVIGSVSAESVATGTPTKKYRKSPAATVDQNQNQDQEQEQEAAPKVSELKTKNKKNKKQVEESGDEEIIVQKQEKRRRRSKNRENAAEEETQKVEKASEPPEEEHPAVINHPVASDSAAHQAAGRKVTPARSQKTSEKVAPQQSASSTPKTKKIKKDASVNNPAAASSKKSPRKVTPSTEKLSKKDAGHKGSTAATVRTDSPPQGEKCTKYSYRKSCQSGGGDVVEGVAKPAASKPAVVLVQVPSSTFSTPSIDGVKCGKYAYRKSCQQSDDDDDDDDDRKKSIIKPPPTKKKSELPLPPAPKSITPADDAPATGSTRCTKYSYRKSCQEGGGGNGERVPIIVTKSAAAPESPKKVHRTIEDNDEDNDEYESTPVKCTKYSYRISCRGREIGDENEGGEEKIKKRPPPPPSSPKNEEKRSVETIDSGKPICGKYSYRKSCQGAAGNVVVPLGETKKAAVVTKKDSGQVKPKKAAANPHPSPSPSPSPSAAPNSNAPNVDSDGNRCTKYSYRKSCQHQEQSATESASKSSPPQKQQHQPIQRVQNPSPPSPASNSGVPCNKYRKSCQSAVGGESASAEKEETTTTKAKKPCKKKDSTSGKKESSR